MSATAVARVSEALRRAKATQSSINAYTSIDEERALERAAAVDARLARGDEVGPLAGVPVGLKDLIDQEGRVTTCGSAFYRHRAERSARAVDRLEAAGAVIIGRTGLHEFAFGFSTENPHFGPVRNPWDVATSTGGSSGGSAASVAAGITPIAVGTDTGGSIRVPAALCGTYGLKVTYGAIPLDGVFPLVPSVDTVGPVADSIDGLEAAYRAMSGDRRIALEIGPVTFGIPQPWTGDAPIDHEVQAEFESAVSALEALGHEVEQAQMPSVIPPGEIRAAISGEVAEVHRPFRRAGKRYGHDVEERISDAETVTSEETAGARAWQLTIRSEFETALGRHRFLITPTVPARRKLIGVDEINGRHYRGVLSWFTSLVNQALLPAIVLPLTGTPGPPGSIQVIGSRGSEPELLALARSLEASKLVRFVPAPSGF